MPSSPPTGTPRFSAFSPASPPMGGRSIWSTYHACVNISVEALPTRPWRATRSGVENTCPRPKSRTP